VNGGIDRGRLRVNFGTGGSVDYGREGYIQICSLSIHLTSCYPSIVLTSKLKMRGTRYCCGWCQFLSLLNISLHRECHLLRKIIVLDEVGRLVGSLVRAKSFPSSVNSLNPNINFVQTGVTDVFDGDMDGDTESISKVVWTFKSFVGRVLV
jgi:hypothetical protein